MAREWTAELLNWKNLEEGSAGKPASNPENDPEVIALREELANQAHELERQNREGDLALLKAGDRIEPSDQRRLQPGPSPR